MAEAILIWSKGATRPSRLRMLVMVMFKSSPCAAPPGPEGGGRDGLRHNILCSFADITPISYTIWGKPSRKTHVEFPAYFLDKLPVDTIFSAVRAPSFSGDLLLAREGGGGEGPAVLAAITFRQAPVFSGDYLAEKAASSCKRAGPVSCCVHVKRYGSLPPAGRIEDPGKGGLAKNQFPQGTCSD